MSQIKIFKFFSVPVFEFQIENYENINFELLNFIYSLKKENPDGLIRSNAGGWHSPFFKMKENETIKKFIKSFNGPLFNIVTKQMGWNCTANQIIIINMWAIINKKNTFNLRHSHPNSLLSAAYYVKANDQSGEIKFFDPKDAKTMHHPEISIYNDLSSDTVKIKPEEGKLLIFPSYIHHAVEENLSDQDRVVISFNIDIK